MKNKVITTNGNIQFVSGDGKVINVSPTQVYSVYGEDNVSFLLVHFHKTSGLALMTSMVSDLELNGQVYSSVSALEDAIADAWSKAGSSLRCEIVDELPTVGQENVIYLVPSEYPSEMNVYSEYIWQNGEFEKLGDTSVEIDLDNYYTKAETNALLDDKVNVTTFDSTNLVVSRSLNDLNTRKLDASAYTPTDLSNYYNKTEVNGLLDDKQDTLVAGRGINITNDTISFNLPISAGTGNGSIIEGSSTSAMSYSDHAEGFHTYANGNGYAAHAEGYETSAMTYSCHAEGRNTKAAGDKSHAEGNGTVASGACSHAEGNSTKAIGSFSHTEGYATSATSVSNVSGIDTYFGYQTRHAEGAYTKANNGLTHTEGYFTVANNFGEHASGVYNASNSATTTFGDSGNTLFSVGNGTADNARHNAFEIRQNGDIYINKDGQDIKLQDNLGSEVSSAITSGDTNAVAGGAVYDRFDEVEQVTAAALINLDEKKLDASAYTPTDLSNYYTKSQVYTKAETNSAISAATSGKADSSSVYTYVAADKRITVATTTGNHRKAIGLGVDVYKGSGSQSLSLISQQGTGQGDNNIKGSLSTGIGWGLSTNNLGEVAVGQYNKSVSATTTFGNSGNTLFSIGNGQYKNKETNAFEVRQNGDIYIVDTNDTTHTTWYKPMVKLQDTITALGGLKLVKLSQAEYNALATKDNNTLYVVVG